MWNDPDPHPVPTVPMPAGLQRVLGQLPKGGWVQQAVEAGEIDAVIDHGRANVIVLPAARRALLEAARRAAVAQRKAATELPARNGLLAALPRAAYLRLLPHLEHVRLAVGEVLHEAGAPIRHVYFPVEGVVAQLTPIDGGRTVETGLVGREGIVGVALALGVDVSSVRAVVQVAGAALRMPAAPFAAELLREQHLQRLLYRCAQAELDLARQTAACIAAHRFEQRLACWLLLIGDRALSHELALTQEHLADVLDVRRVSVTLASGALRASGLIGYHRGRISILDRKGLEGVSCRCFRVIRVAYAG